MAIQFARIEIVGRGSGGNACCKGAYNARTNITDIKTNIAYNFSNRGDDVYHEVLLPKHVDKSFADTKVLMNAVEHIERKHNSQLLKDVVIALPDDKELGLQDRINITCEIIEEMGWVKNGLAVQMDIHKPHNGENNWHAHLLVTTRRFSEDGKSLFRLKARDLNPEFKTGKNGNYIVPEEDIIHEKGKRIINRYFKKLGLANRVDSIGIITQEHIGPVRMRSVLNQAAKRNDERRVAEIEHLNCGARVLEKVTRHMNIFTKGDLIRAVKYVPDLETKEKLVEEALSNKAVIALYQEDGKVTQYFTTKEVRIEERKILRLSNYVAGGINVFTSNKDISHIIAKLISAAGNNLTEEQSIALTSLLTSKSGLQIVRGRAGVGKSHVLRQIATIAQELKVHAIGVAPTHKAKEALLSDGFTHTDTIKGMLFKLHNGRFDLPKNSVLVVDEAGMIGNDDFSELLRVAATRKCTVILSGDERQLTSVQRGGMFEVLASQYGSSTLLDIKRQDSQWGKQVAMALSKGDVRTGVTILEQEKRIKWQSDANESMQSLLADWHKSSYAIDDRIILAVKNKDVAVLNHGVRQYLKLDGKLNGQEIAVGSNHYMRGDRIVISSTNKEIGVVNGEIGVILDCSSKRFIISVNNANYIKDSKDSKTSREHRLVEFNPSEFNSFKHGYAVTIFKGQGASIKDVYFYHNGFAGLRNSYVALSRNISELNLYVNKIATSSFDSLVRQISSNLENGSSLNYLTRNESKDRLENIETINNIGLFDSLLLGAYNFVERNITKLTDKYLPETEYYHYREPSKSLATVEEVLDRVYEENQHVDTIVETREEKLVVGGNFHSSQINIGKKLGEMGHVANTIAVEDDVTSSESNVAINNTGILSPSEVSNILSTTRKSSAKARFYDNVDYRRRQEQRTQENRERYRSEVETLRRELTIRAESLAIDLLGWPNSKLSNKSTLKYGNNGSLAVKISGSKSGTWYDFELGKGGDLFDLVQQEKHCDFKESVNYLQDKLGIHPNVSRPSVQAVNDYTMADKYVDHYKQQSKDKVEELKKIRKAENLYARSKVIEASSTAAQYLVQTRNIDIDFAKDKGNDILRKNSISQDIRTTTFYKKSVKQEVAVLVAFVRDANGNITGGQQIFLDSKTNNKSDVDVPKRSFGKISGSFVNVGRIGNNRLFAEFASAEEFKEATERRTATYSSVRKDSNTGETNKLPAEVELCKRYNTENGNRNIVIIAEGLETALSVKQALSHDVTNEDKQIKILCSLGISNIKNYQPVSGEKIIIAADNDGIDAVTNTTINTAKNELLSKGAFVEIVRPNNSGDFNDILKDKLSGEQEIQNSFNIALTKHAAVTLEQYFDSSDEGQKLTKQEKANISYIQQFKINEEKIIDAYRDNHLNGSIELDTTRKSISVAENFVNEHKWLITEANYYGAKIDKYQLIVSLVGKNYDEMEKNITRVRDKYYIIDHVEELVQAKQKAKTPQQALQALANEQKYLASLHDSKNYNNINRYKFHEIDHSQELLANINKANELWSSNEIDKLNKTAYYAYKEKIISEEQLTRNLQSDHHIDTIHNNINSFCYKYHCDLLKEHCNKIVSGQSIMHQGHEFDCVVKYLEHWKENVDHRMLPINDINHTIERELENQIEHDHHHSLDL